MIPGARLHIFGWREYAFSFSDHDHKKARNIFGAMGCILLALVLMRRPIEKAEGGLQS